MRSPLLHCLIATASLFAHSAVPARADYAPFGLGMTVQTGTVPNGQLHVQAVNNLWSATSLSGIPTNSYVNSFPGINADSYNTAWIVTAVYGGSNLNTARVTVSVNGNQVAAPIVGNAGGINDANPNVSGSSVAGIWVLTVPVNASLLNIGSSASNEISVVVSDKTTGATQPFDGRSFYQSLVTVTQTASLNNLLNYSFVSGAGDIGQTSGGFVTNRTLNLGGFNSSLPVTQADLHAIYTYGDAGQQDALLLNGTSLLGNDVAFKNGTANFPADIVQTSVPTGLLSSMGNQLKFTVDPSDFMGGTLESSLRPQFAAFSVTQAVPEPSALILVGLGTGVAWLRKKRRSAIKRGELTRETL